MALTKTVTESFVRIYGDKLVKKVFIIDVGKDYLLRWDLKSLRPHINLLIDIYTGNDKEDSRPPGPSCQESSKTENDGSLVFLIFKSYSIAFRS